MAEQTLSEILGETTQTEKLKDLKNQAKHTLQYYIDKHHPAIPEQCQVCGSSAQLGKVIPDHKHPLEINLLCQDCINNVFNHTGLPISELPDTINVKALPKQPALPNRSTVRKKLSDWRSRHREELSSLRCQGCGVKNQAKKLRLIPPDLRHPFKVNAVCPSCDYHFRTNDNYPEPIDLLEFTHDELAQEAEQARTQNLAHKTQKAIEHTLKIFDTKPTRCSFCDDPINTNYKTIIDSPGDIIHFYAACDQCLNFPDFPQDYTQLQHALKEPDFVLLKGRYSVSELISKASFDSS